MEQTRGYRFDKVSLNAVYCQTAASKVSVCKSKELELKGLEITCNSKKCARIAKTEKLPVFACWALN